MQQTNQKTGAGIYINDYIVELKTLGWIILPAKWLKEEEKSPFMRGDYLIYAFHWVKDG